MAVEITLAQFNKIAIGDYNAGFVDFKTKTAPGFYKAALLKRHAMQATMVAKYDPTRMFWPSSPCAVSGANSTTTV